MERKEGRVTPFLWANAISLLAIVISLFALGINFRTFRRLRETLETWKRIRRRRYGEEEPGSD
jgi:hypothetical protein